MTEIRNITYRLLPRTAGKPRDLSRLAGACRYVWNEMLGQQKELHLACKADGCPTPSPTFYTLGKRFTKLRERTPWLQEMPFAPVRYTLKYQADRLAGAFQGQRTTRQAWIQGQARERQRNHP